jgi:predicted metalloprotease with PDZ domain
MIRSFMSAGIFLLFALNAVLLSYASFAQIAPAVTNSVGVEPAVVISVDLRDAPKHIFHAKLTMPVNSGPLTLVYPKWIQGEHSPVGPMADLTGLKMSCAGNEISWRRDSVDMFALHLDIPEGATRLDISLDYLSPAEANGTRERPASTAKLAVLNWYVVTLYPQGAKTDDLTYVPSVQLPAGWKYATALRAGREDPDEVSFMPVSLTTLIDSPLISGAYMRDIDLSPGQQLAHIIHMVADGRAALSPTADEVQHMRQLVAESGALFGARHYSHYDFLLTLSDHLPPDGVEHHESSDNRTPEGLFLDPDLRETQMDLLSHEFTHSWNGKYRRPQGLVASDYQIPLKGDLLWVYEGLTQYYGVMLTARAGFWTAEKFRENLAATAAYLNNSRPGRTWRSLEDTAISAQLLYSLGAEGSSWRRGVDYYDESILIWLEADTIIRRETKNKKSLDDFCRGFYGGENTRAKVVPYNFEDVVAAMNQVTPYGWREFFTERVSTHGPGAPLGGLENSGWKLVFTETMNDHQRSEELTNQEVDVQYSLGFYVHLPGGEQSDRLLEVIHGSAADLAGLAPGMQLIAVNGRKWTPEVLLDAIRRAKTGKEPIELLVASGDYFQTYRIDYHGGERYPHLEAIAGKSDMLSDISRRKAPAVPQRSTY